MVLFAVALPLGGQVLMAAAAKPEKKGLFDWLNGALDKEGLLETDPVLKKVDGKNGSESPAKKGAPSAPQKKPGFFGIK